MNTMPGPALLVKSVTGAPVVGGPAIPVYGYSAAPTDGRAVLGGPATRVKILSASDLVANGGTFYLMGAPLAIPVVTADASTPVAGGPVIAVYPVNAGWPSGGGGGLPQVASATLLLDLRASQLALADGDPVATWADASGNGRDFTQSGSARPTYRAGGGVPYVEFDGIDDWLNGSNFADNLAAFAVFYVKNHHAGNSATLQKLDPTSFAGWVAGQGQTVGFYINDVSGNTYQGVSDVNGNIIGTPFIGCVEKSSNAALRCFTNGVETTGVDDGGVVTDFSSTPQPIEMGRGLTNINTYSYEQGDWYSILLYQITDYTAWNSTDRAAIETWLATNP